MIVLIAIGVALTTSPVVYKALESAEFFKVGLTIVFLVIAIVAAISPSDWGDLGDNVANFGTLPTDDVAISTLLAGLVFAGAGGANNLVAVQLDPREGLRHGRLRPADRVAAHRRARAGRRRPASMVRQDEENINRFNGWFKVANREQLVSFWAICLASIIVFSVLAYSTVFGKNISDSADFDFIKGEGEVLKDVVGPWFGTFFWIFGSISLVLVALGVVDYVARLCADVLKTLHLRDNERWSESKIYAAIVWTMCLLGIVVLALGLRSAARAARAVAPA